MSLLAQAKADIEQITSNSNEWTSELSFVAPTGETAVINGLHTKHHLAFDTDGRPVNSKNAHISFSESLLSNLEYPVRNDAGEVHLKNHMVTVKDSTGLDKNYLIAQWIPDETIGFIVCILSDRT